MPFVVLTGTLSRISQVADERLSWAVVCGGLTLQNQSA